MARILIIEDDIDLSELYALSLEDAGHEIVGTYQDPRDALPDGHGPVPLPDPHVIILDDRFRDTSGLAYLEVLQSAYPAARVLVATADPSVAAEALDRGADCARQKPFTMRGLTESVEALAGPS